MWEELGLKGLRITQPVENTVMSYFYRQRVADTQVGSLTGGLMVIIGAVRKTLVTLLKPGILILVSAITMLVLEPSVVLVLPFDASQANNRFVLFIKNFIYKILISSIKIHDIFYISF